MKKSTIIYSVIIIIVILAIGGYFTLTNKPHTPVACTMEAKICPDGSFVGRTGPNCTFALCPSPTAGWNTYNNFGISFQYPQSWGFPQENIYMKVPQIVFNANGSSPFFVGVFEFSDIVNGPQTFDQYMKNATSNNSPDYTVRDILAGGMAGKEINHFYGKTELYNAILPFDSQSAMTFDGDSSFLSEDTFSKIVSSFRADASSQVKTDTTTGMFIYKNSIMQFEYPAKLNSNYINLSLQVMILSPGDKNIDSSGCYMAQTARGGGTGGEAVTINNIRFCLAKGSDVGAGQAYNSYYYTTLRGGEYYVVEYLVHSPNACGGYENSPDVNAPGNEKYKACMADESNWDSIVTKPIQNSIATFKFINQ